MSREQRILERLADIVPPAAPDLPVGWLAALAALAVVLAAAGLRRRRRHQPAAVIPPCHAALIRLHGLRAAWEAGEIDDREAAYRLAALLRLSYALPQLSDTPPPPLAAEAAAWREVLRELHHRRYGAAAPALPAALFDQAQRWLTAAGAET